MALVSLNQTNYDYGQYSMHYNDSWNYTLNQRVVNTKDDDLSSLLRVSDTITNDLPSLLGNSFYEIEQTDTELDPAIQELILQNESHGNNTMNFESPGEFMIKQEEVDSDNDSVMLEYEDLDFLDREQFVDSDDSNAHCYANSSPKLRTSSRSSVDSGYEDGNIPRFDCIYDNKLCISSDGYDEDGDIDSKPYCKSNRGAKKNLLWKFILETLKDKKQTLISWQNEQEGTFKFDDTVTFSKKWGARKGKNDMNFEKLSRAIRHYYKNGLMSRISTERLVYKFNWKSVPLRYRRY